MADTDGGGRRPPLPRGYRTGATPPPTPAARATPPSPLVAPQAGFAQCTRPPAEAKRKFKQITGDAFYRNFLAALKILCDSCGFEMVEFTTRPNALLFRGAEIAAFANGAMEIPLGRLANEDQVYDRIYPSVLNGTLPAPSFAGLSKPPNGKFIRISESGIELCFREAVAVAPASPAAGQETRLGVDRPIVSMVKNIVVKLNAASQVVLNEAGTAISEAISVDGNSIFFRSGVDLAELAKIPESGGEVRIYLDDMRWAATQCKTFLNICKASISEDKVAFIFMHKHVYFRIRENGFALCASNKKESAPSFYLVFAL